MKHQIVISLFLLIQINAKSQFKSNKDSIDHQFKTDRFMDSIFSEQEVKEKKIQGTISTQRKSYTSSYSEIKSKTTKSNHLISLVDTLYISVENVFHYFDTFIKNATNTSKTEPLALWVDLERACNDSILKTNLTNIYFYSNKIVIDPAKKVTINNTLSYITQISYRKEWWKPFNWGWLENASPDIENRVSKVASIIFKDIKDKL
jgi:hypothetical protein